MPTVAVIGTYDTKTAELGYIAERLQEFGVATLAIDLSTSPTAPFPADIDRSTVASVGGHDWEELRFLSRDDMRATMAIGASRILLQLLQQGQLDGVIAAGGVQNTTVVAHAMWTLPVGLPKVIVSTVASGSRPFDMVVGTRDITVIPAITDVAGLNRISRTILREAAAAMAGMVRDGSGPVKLTPGDAPVIGATLMGAINDGATRAIAQLQERGYEVLSFHSTGVGGQVLEDLIRAGTITAVADMSLHEIVHEVVGGGFCAGATGRLTAAAEMGIPIVAAPAATDFMCFLKQDVTADWLARQHVWHNESLAHFALPADLATTVAMTIADRLNSASGPVHVILPEGGLRAEGQRGGKFEHLDLTNQIIDTLEGALKSTVQITRIAASANSAAFGDAVVTALTAMLAKEALHV